MRRLFYALTGSFLISCPSDARASLHPKYAVAEGVPLERRENPIPYEENKLVAVLRGEYILPMTKERRYSPERHKVYDKQNPRKDFGRKFFDRRVI